MISTRLSHHPFVNPQNSRCGARLPVVRIRKALAGPRRVAVNNGQHLIHQNFMEEIFPKMNDRKKFDLTSRPSKVYFFSKRPLKKNGWNFKVDLQKTIHPRGWFVFRYVLIKCTALSLWLLQGRGGEHWIWEARCKVCASNKGTRYKIRHFHETSVMLMI